VAAWFAQRPYFAHVRTRHRSPGTNGVNERWFQSRKYERLYRHDITYGIDLARHPRGDLDAVALALNARPRKTLGWKTPAESFNELLRSA
jgi:IS30 family transposase